MIFICLFFWCVDVRVGRHWWVSVSLIGYGRV